MPSKEEKERRKKIADDLSNTARERFKESLPMSVENFHQLFDFLDEQLTEVACDHNTVLTEKFLDSIGADKEKVILFLNELGGYCDCEVLANAEDHFENL